MPSNDSPAFDVLSAEESDLWEWAVERAGVENAATFIRDAAEAAVRARQLRCGGSDAGLAYGKLRKEYDALKQSRDTDLACARVEGAREALTRLATWWSEVESHTAHSSVVAKNVTSFRAREYPAPKPAECRLSDGSVVGWNPSTKMFCASRPDWYCQTNDWRTLAMTVEDFATLKAFAATRTEGTDGR